MTKRSCLLTRPRPRRRFDIRSIVPLPCFPQQQPTTPKMQCRCPCDHAPPPMHAPHRRKSRTQLSCQGKQDYGSPGGKRDDGLGRSTKTDHREKKKGVSHSEFVSAALPLLFAEGGGRGGADLVNKRRARDAIRCVNRCAIQLRCSHVNAQVVEIGQLNLRE